MILIIGGVVSNNFIYIEEHREQIINDIEMKAVFNSGKNNISSKLTIGKSYDVILSQTTWCLYIPSCFG
jgi:hypothetical protein